MRESRRRTMRDGLAAAVALLLHAAALAVIGWAERPRAPAAKLLPAPRADEIAVELGDVPFEPSEGPAFEPNGPSSGARARPPRGRAPAVVSLGAERPGREVVAALAPPASEGEGAAAPSAAASVAAAPEASAARPLDLGLGADAWTRWLPPGGQGPVEPPLAHAARAPLVKAPPASSSGGLQEGLEAADRRRLVGPSGRVVSALEQAAHGEGATAFGIASFAVTVLRTGGVEVTLQSASTGDAEWKRVAERAARDLAKNAPRIAPPREGARFVVDLVAEMLTPDGRRVKELHGPRVEANPPRVHSWSAGKQDMLERNPTGANGVSLTDPDLRANVELPGVYVAQNGKVCSYKFGLSLLGPLLQGGCEPENIGAKPQRVVHAHVRTQELF